MWTHAGGGFYPCDPAGDARLSRAELVVFAAPTMDRLAPVRDAADRAEFLLFSTGWDRFWGREAYFGDYPVLGEDVVDYLIASGKRGVGVDTLGVDPIRDEALPIHRRLLDSGMVIIENLTNLAAAGTETFTFCALPLHYENADGAPVRAVGLWL